MGFKVTVPVNGSMSGLKLLLSVKISFNFFNNSFLFSISTLLPAFLKFLRILPVISSISIIAFSAMFVSLANKPSYFFCASKPSCANGPLALKGLDIHLSIHRSMGSMIALPVPPEFLNLDIPLPAAPIAPVNSVPSTPNFNLFNNSV